MNRQALGIVPHTGWAVCVVVAGTMAKPHVIANRVVEFLPDPERFCYHRAAERGLPEAEGFLTELYDRALVNARVALAPMLETATAACAIVAKAGVRGDTGAVLQSHPRMHSSEGLFYRDVLLEACHPSPMVVDPSSLDPKAIGKLAPPPWGRDQRLAAIAALKALSAAR